MTHATTPDNQPRQAQDDVDLRKRADAYLRMVRDRLTPVEKEWDCGGRFVFELEQFSPLYPPEQGGLIAETDESLAPLIAAAPSDLRKLLAALDAVATRLDQGPADGTVSVAEIRAIMDRGLDYRY
jgi:hypothetical protein